MIVVILCQFARINSFSVLIRLCRGHPINFEFWIMKTKLDSNSDLNLILVFNKDVQIKVLNLKINPATSCASYEKIWITSAVHTLHKQTTYIEWVSNQIN